MLEHFLKPCREHFTVECVIIDVTVSKTHHPIFEKWTELLKACGFHTQLFIRHTSSGSQNKNFVTALRRVTPIRNTFVLRGDCYLFKPFPFNHITDVHSFYVISKMPREDSDGKKQFRVVDTFWYLPQQRFTYFERALQKNISLQRDAMHNFYWKRLPDLGVPSEKLRYILPREIAEPAITSLMCVINRTFSDAFVRLAFPAQEVPRIPSL